VAARPQALGTNGVVVVVAPVDIHQAPGLMAALVVRPVAVLVDLRPRMAEPAAGVAIRTNTVYLEDGREAAAGVAGRTTRPAPTAALALTEEYELHGRQHDRPITRARAAA
jgi:hypothetical protein